MSTRDRSVYVPFEVAAVTVPDTAYQIDFSRDVEDPAWDAFVAQAPGGHHAQTSAWALVKACLGWEGTRVIATQKGRIVAGVQMLIRRLPVAGAVGYVAKGPVCAVEDPDLAALVLRALHWLARSRGVRYLAVHPPSDGHALARRLSDSGFWRTAISVAPTATALLDLSKDHGALLAGMRVSTRHNIRQGLRRGIAVWEGTGDDLAIFCRLLAATARRQGFAPEPAAYISTMYRILAPRSWLRLFVTRYQGEPVSAALAMCFGETVFYKRGAWSGCHGQHHPNEVMHWEIIRWAKARGYRYYDFEGIEPACASAVLRGEPIPTALQGTVSSFKLGFGGRAVLFPGVYAYAYNPFLRWAGRALLSGISDFPFLRRGFSGVRTDEALLHKGALR